MSSKNRTGFGDTNVRSVLLAISITIVVMTPVFQCLRTGVRNGFNVQELFGTAITSFGAGLFVAIIFVFSIAVLFYGFAGLMISADYIRRRRNRK